MVRLDRWARVWRDLGVAAAVVALAGGCETPSAHTSSRNYGLRGDIPVDSPRLTPPVHEDDCAAGGRLFKLYCGSCHNARPLSERPFSNFEVVAAHMRDQAYLTGKEYRQIILFLRRWHNVGPPTPDVEPSSKRFIFSQPISELRAESPAETELTRRQPPGAGTAARQPLGAAGASPRQPPEPKILDTIE